jgi:hypothetical protein
LEARKDPFIASRGTVLSWTKVCVLFGAVCLCIWLKLVAHTIRVHSTSFAKAVCDLEARCRWAVTGTPIQNRLSDLFNLFKFLRVAPFDDVRSFKCHITQNWKSRSDPTAVAKLKLVVSSLTLRRTKDIVDLPKRSDKIHYVDLGREERDLFEKVRLRTRKNFESFYLSQPNRTFLNALQLINSLRLICNHGTAFEFPGAQSGAETPLRKVVETSNMFDSSLHLPAAFPDFHSIPDLSETDQTGNRTDGEALTAYGENGASETPSKLPWNRVAGQIQFESILDTGLAICAHCRRDLSWVDRETDEATALFGRGEPHLSESLHLLCFLCFKEQSPSSRGYFPVCNHVPRCRKMAILNKATQPKGCRASSPLPEVAKNESSTKIRTLVQDLLNRPKEEKRYAQCPTHDEPRVIGH